MKNITFAEQSVTDGHIFPIEITNMAFIGYHGTAKIYDSEINMHGIVPPSNQVADITETVVLDLLKKHNEYDELAMFRLNTISFSPLSAKCLQFVSPDMIGGQRTKLIEDAIAKIMTKRNTILSDIEKSIISKYKLHIQNIRNHGSIIYACNLSDISSLEFRTTMKSLTIKEILPPDKIIAKLEIPAGVTIPHAQNLDEIFKDLLRNENMFINKIPHKL